MWREWEWAAWMIKDLDGKRNSALDPKILKENFCDVQLERAWVTQQNNTIPNIPASP